MEKFVPIKNYPEYLISNKGNVYSVRSRKLLSPAKMPPCKGHTNPNKWCIKLCVNKKRYNTMVHTLVGRHFLPEYEEGMLILHKDEALPFPEINYVENLWCGTQSDNRKDCVKKGRTKQTRDRNGRFIGL